MQSSYHGAWHTASSPKMTPTIIGHVFNPKKHSGPLRPSCYLRLLLTHGTPATGEVTHQGPLPSWEETGSRQDPGRPTRGEEHPPSNTCTCPLLRGGGLHGR